MLIDESHNLRNRDGKRYRAIQDYIGQHGSRVILVSATPYNKTYLDLANQLRLFLAEDKDLGIRPEALLKTIGLDEFSRRHQCEPRTLAAFEKSQFPDDWRELMRLYMVRRTRSFIQDNYADTDTDTGRKFLTFADGSRSYFPIRQPRAVKFKIDDRDPSDQYASLYSAPVVAAINELLLPRYGLGNYVRETPRTPPTGAEAKVISDLSRAGVRLKGFCRTNLFKRLESSGQAFLQSVERHVLRNFVYLHAIANDLPLPIGTQDAALLDARVNDRDDDLLPDDEDEAGQLDESDEKSGSEPEFRRRAAQLYGVYAGRFKNRFRWLPAGRFVNELARDLEADNAALLDILYQCGEWDAGRDAKLKKLISLLTQKHPREKVLVFSQFADTVAYLARELVHRRIGPTVAVTGDAPNPTAIVWRFSPESSEKRPVVSLDEEVRVLIATDVLSEGQNLQDAAIIVNYDLPWAIIRLIQRAGRVDRIGQKAGTIACYTFLPADGVERIIRLRARVRQRLKENAEVVGSDETFFEDDRNDQVIRDLFTEKAGILDGDADTETDFVSQAFQIWKNAIDRDPRLEQIIKDLPEVVYATRPHEPAERQPEGVLLYVRTAEGTDALSWVDSEGRGITESQLAILKAAECTPDTPALPRRADHHELVRKGVEQIAAEEKRIGGQLGRPSGARFRTYERLERYADEIKGTLFDSKELRRAIEDIYNYPLRQVATDTLNRQLRVGIRDEDLARRVVELREDGRLCVPSHGEESYEPRIICSLGLKPK